MSDVGTFDFDADGYVDMSLFPDDGTELGDAELADLRETLLTDPIEDVAPADWEAMVEDVVVGDYDADSLGASLGTAGAPGVDDAGEWGVIPGGGPEDSLALDGGPFDGFEDSLALDDDALSGDHELELDSGAAQFDDFGDDGFDAIDGAGPETGEPEDMF
jgi:hypothetical protein